jgi:hypothetical protein
MAEKKRENGALNQHSFVDQVRPDPSSAPSSVATLEGIPGNSDRDGWARIYFNRALTYYAEFRKEDVVVTEPLTAEQSPVGGIESTRVGIRRDAVIEYTRTSRAKPSDEFDLDIQLAGSAVHQAQPNVVTNTCADGCIVRTELCTDVTCGTCRTCGQATCNTCHTACGTCNTCNTCQTACGQATCQTCQTACGTCQTCQTCATACGTCNTCQTCQTCRTQCNQPTCQDTCRTCFCTDTCHRPCV